jgi:hypothetical protein
MGDFVEITNADAVRAAGARLSAEGEAMTASATAAVGAISGIEGETPWGNDHFGEAFLTGYNQKAQSSDQGASASVKDSLSALGPNASTIGDATTQAMLDYTSADEVNATEISNVAR